MKDRKFRVPRIWSNNELKKFAPMFSGKVINVSGWKDIDKEGGRYKDYFVNATEYWVSNYKSEARGFQGDLNNEIYMDLSVPLAEGDSSTYDVVYNHTVLEHIFEVDIAFTNLCKLSSDVVILVVPFLQEQHANYGDYWRFTPQAIDKLFRKNGFQTLYISANSHSDASVYVFAVASKAQDKWNVIIETEGNIMKSIYAESAMIGRNVISNSRIRRFLSAFYKMVG